VANTNQAAKALKYDRRVAPREKFQPIQVRGLTSLDHKTQVARNAYIMDASVTGFLLHIDRKDLVPKEYRDALALTALEGDRVILMIDPLNLEIAGKIARTRRLNKDMYEICVDFSSDAPEYWRAALIDMLPRSHDFTD
jgi:hypothetical protein